MKAILVATLYNTYIKIGDAEIKFGEVPDVDDETTIRAIVFAVVRTLEQYGVTSIIITRAVGKVNKSIINGICELYDHEIVHGQFNRVNFDDKWDLLLSKY